MKTDGTNCLLVASIWVATLLPLAAIDWPKGSFTVDKLAEARELAEKEKKPLAFIIMERGTSADKKEERRKRREQQQGADAARTLTERLAKDCARFAVVVNVQPGDLQTQPLPFTEKEYGAFAGALGPGTIPALVIADARGTMVFACAGSGELSENTATVLRDARRNIKDGKEQEFKEPKEEKKERKERDRENRD